MTQTKKLSAAIIGAGQIAGGYDSARRPGEKGVYTHAGAYSADGGFSLKTVCEKDARRGRAFAKAWKIPNSVTRLSDLTHSFHDVISICTPDATHFAIASALLKARCCRVVFLEKPAAATIAEIDALSRLSKKARIPVVVDYQRRFDPAHRALRERVRAGAPLAVNAYHIKGLRHIGATMIDTLIYLLGRPRSLLAYNSVPCRAVHESTVEFVLFFDGFNATVKAADPADGGYAYHIFELDLLFRDRRVSIVENSRRVRTVKVGRFAYSGVKALDEARAETSDAGFDRAMLAAVRYVRGVARGARHDVNRLEDSRNGAAVLAAVERSLRLGRRVQIPEALWKK